MDDQLRSIEQNAKMRDAAIEWSKRTVQEAEDKAGPSATSEKRAAFYVTLLADIGARMYIDLRKDFSARHDEKTGVELAQAMLKTAFNAVGAALRGCGEEVQMRVGVAFEKSANYRAQEKEEEIPLKKKCDHPCTCTLDEDGNCAACIEQFKKTFSGLAQGLRLMKQSGVENLEMCFRCVPRHLDAVLASIVREELSQETPAMAEGVMNAMFLTSQNLMAMPMPLTRKAWSDTQKGYAQ